MTYIALVEWSSWSHKTCKTYLIVKQKIHHYNYATIHIISAMFQAQIPTTVEEFVHPRGLCPYLQGGQTERGHAAGGHRLHGQVRCQGPGAVVSSSTWTRWPARYISMWVLVIIILNMMINRRAVWSWWFQKTCTTHWYLFYAFSNSLHIVIGLA